MNEPDFEDYKVLLEYFFFEPMNETTFQKIEIATMHYFRLTKRDVWLAPIYKENLVHIFIRKDDTLYQVVMKSTGASFGELLV